MKLLLASKEKFLLHTGYALLGIPKEQLRIGFITTAFSVVDDKEYRTYMHEYITEMRANNIFFEEYDIHGKSEHDIRAFLADKNVVQFSGGNPFYLLKAIYESHCDTVLHDVLQAGMCYVGCSAGSYIMCPTIEVGAWKASRNTYGVTDVTALNYVPFLIKCHYTDETYDHVREHMQTLHHPLRVLRDTEALLVTEPVCTFIGEKEMILPLK